MSTALSGPIPQHPMYGGSSPRVSARAVPRVKPEASSFAAHGQNGTVANLFTVTGTSCFNRPSSSAAKQMPKNHVSDNVRRMRQIQRRCRQKQKEEQAAAPIPVKALWKSEKYEAVPSKLAEYLHQSDQEAPRPHSSNFLRAHAKTGMPPRPQSARTPRSPSRQQDKKVEPLSGFPSRSNSVNDLQTVGKSVDFVKLNARAASHVPVRRSPSVDSLNQTLSSKAEKYSEYKRSTLGHVPRYLERRKDGWRKEEEERVRNTPDPDQPAGHRLMPKEERLETLALLQQSHSELTRKLAALPIRSDTLRVRTAKQELESKLSEVEEAMQIFGRTKVFVKCDD